MQSISTFGQWLKQRRRELDLTQEAIAESVACSTDTVYKIEAGRRRPSRQMAELLAECLDVPPDERLAFVQWARGASHIPPPIAHSSTEPAPDASRLQTSPPTSASAELRPVSPTLTFAPRPSTSLPLLPTTLIGRERDLARAKALLWRSSTRLLTLLGPPGIGKTSLGIAVASALQSDFKDGLVYVPLGPIRDPALVGAAIAEGLGVRETPAQTLLDGLQSALRDKQILLVLDNFEQVVEAATLVSHLLASATGLKVLVTSRLALHLRGEKVLAVPPLDVPGSGFDNFEEVGNIGSVALFVERAQDVDPDFALNASTAKDVAAICTRLEGLPLAIELAAAKLRVLTLPGLLARLEGRLALLTDGRRDAPTHQQTLRKAIESSYDLLSAREQEVFRRLGVFTGVITLEAAGAIAGADLDTLAALVDQSLIYPQRAVEGEGREGERRDIETRFAMLEMIREYALERLEQSGEAKAVRRLHAEYYQALLKSATLEWSDPGEGEWLDRLDVERHNLRSALRWATTPDEDHGVEIEMALSMSAVLWNFWNKRGYISEGRDELEAVLSLTDSLFPEGLLSAEYAKVLAGAGRLAINQDDNDVARRYLERSREIARRLGDDVAGKKALSYALTGLMIIADCDRNYTLLRQLGEERLALHKALGDEPGKAAALTALGKEAQHEGNYDLARRLYQESLDIARKLGGKGGVGAGCFNLAVVAQAQSDYEAARSFNEESLTIWREQGNKNGIAITLYRMGSIARQQGNYTEALMYLTESLAIYHELGNRGNISRCLANLSAVWCAQGNAAQAARLAGAAQELKAAIDEHFGPAEQATFDVSVETMRGSLGEEAFEAARREGALMSLQEAVQYAMST